MGTITVNIVIIMSVLICSRAYGEVIDRKYIKCLVCLRVVEEIFKDVLAVDPSLKYNRGSYVFDQNKNKELDVELRRSEIYLVELMDRVCKKMDDYVRAYKKSTGLIEVIPLIVNGGMNPALSEYDIVKDGDLDSLKFYCESIISEYEEEIINLFKSSAGNIDHKLCNSTEICMTFNHVNLHRLDEL